MPDPLKFQVEVDANTEGADQTKKALQEVEQASKEINKVGTATARDLEAADEKQIHTKTKLKEALKGIGLEFPELAHLAHLFLNPITAAFALAIFVVGKFRDVLQSLAIALKLPEFTSSAEAWKQQRDALFEADLQARAFASSLQHVADDTQEVITKTDALLDAIRGQARGQLELSNANQALALAQIDADEKAGKIGGVEAIQKRLAAQKQFADQQRTLQQKERDDTLKAEKDKYDALNTLIVQLEKRKTDAEAAAKAAGDEQSVRTLLASAKKNAEAQVASLKERNEQAKRLLESPEAQLAPQARLQLGDVIQKRDEAIEFQQQRIAQFEKTAKARLEEIQQAQTLNKTSEEQLNKAIAARDVEEDKLRVLKQQNAEAKKLADQLAPIQEKTRQVTAGPARTEASAADQKTAAELTTQAQTETAVGLSVLPAIAKEIAGDPSGKLASQEIIDAVVSGLTVIRDANNRENQQLATELRREIAIIKGQLGNRGGN
jgi:hypothetical protein